MKTRHPAKPKKIKPPAVQLVRELEMAALPDVIAALCAALGVAWAPQRTHEQLERPMGDDVVSVERITLEDGDVCAQLDREEARNTQGHHHMIWAPYYAANVRITGLPHTPLLELYGGTLGALAVTELRVECHDAATLAAIHAAFSVAA